jgi:hypothetical protein
VLQNKHLVMIPYVLCAAPLIMRYPEHVTLGLTTHLPPSLHINAGSCPLARRTAMAWQLLCRAQGAHSFRLATAWATSLGPQGARPVPSGNLVAEVPAS